MTAIQGQKVLTMGGGSGQFVLLSGMRDIQGIEITPVVSMVDSGGSTGRLRDELGVLPPGDILKCLLALSPYREMARELLLKRFSGDRRLRGHNAGNMLLTMLSHYTGSFPAGVNALAEILEVRARVLPVTTDKATLVAELTDGSRVFGEEAIDMPRGAQRETIRDVYLVPHRSGAVAVYPPVVQAIEEADWIVIGPGDLFTSIIPNFLVPGVKEAVFKSKAKILYVLNIMTKYGETHSFAAEDFVSRLEHFIERRIDEILYNIRPPSPEIMNRYRLQKAEPVVIDADHSLWKERCVHYADLIDESGGIIRHNPQNMAEAIVKVISRQ